MKKPLWLFFNLVWFYLYAKYGTIPILHSIDMSDSNFREQKSIPHS